MDMFELFDGTCPEELPLDPSPIRADRVMEHVSAALGGKKPRRLSRAVRTALLAAVLAAFMGVTAYAVYELVIDKYIIDQPAEFETEEEAAGQPRTRISLTGYQGTPEYQAFTQWEAYQSEWWEKARERDPWKERGVDDSWHETPDNYAYLYGASFQEQADALDAIVEKYGLTLHQDMAAYYRAKDLYEALGTEPFLSGDIDPISESCDVGGYIYDDGSFKAEFYQLLPGDRRVSMSMFVNAKGSFATISGGVELSEDSQAWQYTTASGEAVDLYLSPNGAEIMAESAGAYMELGVYAGSAPSYDPAADPQLSQEGKAFWLEDRLQEEPDMTEAEQEAAWQLYYDETVERNEASLPPAITREDLQAVADSIDFTVLAERFDGTPHPETARMLTVLKERENARYEASTAAAAESVGIIDQIGRYVPSALPADFVNELMGRQEALDPEKIGLEGMAQYGRGIYFPAATEADTLYYYRIVASSAAPEAYVPTIRSWLEAKFPDGKITDETVQGHPAVLSLMPDHGAVYWYDEDADLLFSMGIDDMGESPAVDRAAVLALAESVEKVG